MFKNLFSNLKNLFKNNKTQDSTAEKILYPCCQAFYKTENTPGWLHSYFNGTKEDVNIKFEKLKSTKELYDFKFLKEFKLDYKIEDFQKANLDATTIHMISNWIYWEELDKWFILDDEEIPYPKTQCEVSEFFNIHSYFPEDMNDWESFEGEEFIYSTVQVYLKSKEQKMESCIGLLKMSKDVESFIENIKQGKFAKLIIESYSYHKFLVWNYENKIRLLVQDYNSDEVKIIFDVLIDKEKFISVFEKTKKHIEKHNSAITKSIKNGLMSKNV